MMPLLQQWTLSIYRTATTVELHYAIATAVDFSHRTATAVELHYEAIAPQWTLSIEQPPTAVELHYAKGGP